MTFDGREEHKKTYGGYYAVYRSCLQVCASMPPNEMIISPEIIDKYAFRMGRSLYIQFA